MKKLYTLILISVIALGMVNAQAPLFFSEYVEGDGGNNKVFEIFNPTGAAVDLAAYEIMGNSNGSEWKYWNAFADGASIGAGEVYVVANSGSIQEILDVTDETSSATYFNGDDARALIYITSTDTTIIDVIGVEGVDPGDGWDVAGVTAATANHTLIRKAGIEMGTADWAASAGTNADDSQWEVMDANDFSNLGFYGETPSAQIFFSEYVEGDGGNNKVLEIFNPTGAAVDLADYEIMGNSNGSEWKYWNAFADGASIGAGEVYVVANSGSVQEILDVTDETSSATYFNGDDARALIYITATDTTIIDVIGVEGVDPGDGWDVAGVTAATANRTLIRKTGIEMGTDDWAASAGTNADDSQWEVMDANDFSNLGFYGESPIITVQTVSLTSSDGSDDIAEDGGTQLLYYSVLPDNATNQEVELTVSDNNLAYLDSKTDSEAVLHAINNGTVTITATAMDGSGITETLDIVITNQAVRKPVLGIVVSGTADASTIDVNVGTLQMIATLTPTDADDATVTWSADDDAVATIDASGLLTAVNNGTVIVTATANDGYGAVGTLEITVSGQYTEVADLSAVRAMDASDKSTVYKITGEVILTFAQSSRNQKVVQDAGAGILIDDSPGVITTVYNPGDGITGLMGSLSEYGSLLQFIPTADPGAASTTGNEILPVEVTIADLNTDHEPYESRLVIVKDVTFDDADGTVAFANSGEYDITCTAGSMMVRVSFKDTDLIGVIVPDSANVTGIIQEYNGTVQLAPRGVADVEELVEYVPSDDASITDLLVDATSVAGFTPAQLSYNVVLHHSTTTVPPVTVVTSNDSADVTVTDAVNLDGTEAERTTTVLITAEDGVASKTYTVIFSLNVGIDDQNGESFGIYPVPAGSTLHVRSLESLSELRVISITGSTLKVVELSGEKNSQLDISELESGVYFLKLTGETSTQILRFVKN